MTIDLAWAIFGWACIQEGAREGVRYAVTCSGQAESSLDSATALVVDQHAFGFTSAGNVSVDYYPSTGYSSGGVPSTLDGKPGATNAGNLVKVTVKSLTLKSFGPLFRAVSPVQLSASASDILQ